MDNGQSNSSRHEIKSDRVASIVGYLIMRHSLAEPTVFWWRDVVRFYSQFVNQPDPLLHKHRNDINRDLKRHKREIEQAFMKSDFDVVFLTSPPIHDILEHGAPAEVNEVLNREFYRSCLPAGGCNGVCKRMMGFVVLPRGSAPHPLVLLSRKRGTNQASSNLVASVMRSDHSESMGTMSPDENRQLRAIAERKCNDAFHPYPLFKEQPTPPPESPPPTGPDDIPDGIPDV